MRAFWTTTAFAVAFAASAGVASAATWDFGNDAELFQDTHGFEGTFDQVYNDGDSILDGENTQGGITVEASAFDHDTGASLDPFMDAEDGDLEIAGLGVCSTGFDTNTTQDGSGDFGDPSGMSLCSTQYDPSEAREAGDDNLVFGEILELMFSTEVQLTELLVKDANHEDFSADHGIIIMTSVDESHPEDVLYFEVIDGVVQGADALGFNSVYYFTSAFKCEYPEYEATTLSDVPQEPVCSNGPEIYLSSLTATPVPLPAAGLLLLGGLGGLAAMKRRRKA